MPILQFFAALALAGLAVLSPAAAGGEASADARPGKDVVIHSGFGSSGIRNWRVIDDNRLLIETSSHGELVATFMQPCIGIRGAETVGFRTLGPFELDRSTEVILPDGFRCRFKSLRPRNAGDERERS